MALFRIETGDAESCAPVGNGLSVGNCSLVLHKVRKYVQLLSFVTRRIKLLHFNTKFIYLKWGEGRWACHVMVSLFLSNMLKLYQYHENLTYKNILYEKPRHRTAPSTE